MKRMLPIVLMVVMVCAQAALCQSPPLYVPHQAPPSPQYAPAAAPPMQPPQQPPAQPGPTRMYDQSYRGPYNVYGQPVITGYRPQQANQQGPAQTVPQRRHSQEWRGV